LKLSFLSYPGFDSEPHPALKRAITIDLATEKARHTDYADNANPPILHRKETFLPAGHPLRAQFEALTRAEEAAGLYESTETIGFKLNWQKLLESKGLALKGHTLLRSFPPPAAPPRPVPEGHPKITQPFKTGSAATSVPSPDGTAKMSLTPCPPVQGSKFEVQGSRFTAPDWMLDVRCWMFGLWTLDFRLWTLACRANWPSTLKAVASNQGLPRPPGVSGQYHLPPAVQIRIPKPQTG
jgi:hypothetical protein